MKKIQFLHSYFVLGILSVAILVLAFASGCRILPGVSDSSDGSSGPSTTSISGKVFKPVVQGRCTLALS